MASNEPEHHSDWRTALAIALIAVGLLLVVASVVMPASATGGTYWSREQAKQYQAASVKLHSLSHTAANAAPEKQQQLRKDLQDAEKEYALRRADLDAAIGRPHRVITILRVAGIALVAAGGVGAYLGRQPA
jgi:predicted negative regulator of RcsB-dependent stress response